MKKLTFSIVAVAVSMAFAYTLSGAAEHEIFPHSEVVDKPAQMQASGPITDQILMGRSIISKEGEEVGKINSVKRDINTGRITYVTMTSGGILGMGEKTIAIPFQAVSFSQELDHVTLLVDRSKLDDTPKQANLSEEEFNHKLQSHYGISPAWKAQPEDIPQSTD